MFPIQSRDNASIKGLQKCPALLNFESQVVVVPCPFDLHLHIDFDPKSDKVQLTNVLGNQSPVNPTKIPEILSVTPRDRWRDPNRPVLQIMTPYRFLTDQNVYINQLPPFMHYSSTHWPGTLVCGRFPLNVWPRLLMWAFEWHDLKQDLILKRGEPWFYVRFECEDPSRMIRLVEAEATPELRAYCNGLDGVTNYVKQTFSLFKIAEKRRPKQLLKPKERNGTRSQ